MNPWAVKNLTAVLSDNGMLRCSAINLSAMTQEHFLSGGLACNILMALSDML